MNFIKHDQYDQMYFSYLEQKYDLTRSLRRSQIKIIDRDMLLDLYNILFKEHLEIVAVKEKEVSRNDFTKFLFINKIIASSYLTRIKRYTVFNEQNSFLFISELLNSFGTFSMWEDEDTESTDELLDSVDSLAKDTKSNHARADYNKEEDPSHTPTENDLSPNKQYDSMLNKLSKYIDTNKALLPPNLNQLGFLPAPDKMKTINTIYDLNSVMDSLGKLKKDLHETTPGVLDKIEKELHELSFNCGSAANKIIIDEMDKYLRQVSLQVEKDIHIKQELYNNLKKLSSHNYWDLALSNLIQTNPEFCFYMSNLIKKHPDIMKITRLMGNLKVIRTRKHKRMTKSTFECKMNISTSNDITNLIPMELLYLEQQLENIFYNKLIEQKLYTYDYKSRSNKGKGGIIVCLDTSGSMIGDQLDLIKAIILNLALRTLHRKRYFALINFSSSMKDILLLPHRPDFKEFINLLTSSFYGGTNFDMPIKRTLEIIENFRHHRESDVLIFSDGFGKLSDEVLNKLEIYKKKYHFGLFGFLIDDNSKSTSIANCCDRIFNLNSSNLLKDLLKHLEKLA